MFLMAVAGMFAFAACNNNKTAEEAPVEEAIEEVAVEEEAVAEDAVEAPVEEEISFQKSRGRKKAPLESELAETAASAAAAAAAAKAAKEAAPAFDDNGVAVGDSLDEIVKKAAGKTSKQSLPKSEHIVEEKFDVEAARNQMAEMEKAAGEAEKPKKQYQLPPLDCLNPPKLSLGGGSEAELRDNAEKLIEVLESFGVRTTLVDEDHRSRGRYRSESGCLRCPDRPDPRQDRRRYRSPEQGP